jgi:23S rRNA pseudouridine1911/1915/1917 synthase
VVAPPQPHEVLVAQEDHGERIDRVLALRLGLPEATRSAVGRWCAQGRVTLAGRPLRAAYRVRTGDQVQVAVPPPELSEARPEALPLEVVYEDPDVLVVDKAAGVVVHPSAGNPSGTLVNAVLHRFAVADLDPLRPGIVHRIDKDTSGLLVVARTPAARLALQAQFKAHTTERSYVAVTDGVPRSPCTLDTLHGRHPTDRLRFTGRVPQGRRAVTHVAVEEVLAAGLAARVRCTLETGRTHQVRVHLSEAGFPLLGDTLYGRKHANAVVRAAAQHLGRQALHAEVLGFDHPTTGRRLRFTAPWPEDLRRLVETLRRSA